MPRLNTLNLQEQQQDIDQVSQRLKQLAKQPILLQDFCLQNYQSTNSSDVSMGCSYVAPAPMSHKRVNGPVGMLEIQICKLYINQKNPLFKGQDIKLKLSVSNQQFILTRKQIQSKEKNSSKIIFTCFINSLYKQFGRMLMIDMWSEETLSKYSSQTRAIGLIDLNPYIQRKNKSDTVRTYLNLQKNNAGRIYLRIKFRKLQYFNFTFRINKFSVQSYQKIKGDCFCRVYAGQEILQTPLHLHNPKQKKKTKISSQLEFCIPKGMQQVQIVVLQKGGQQNIIIGQATIDLNQMTYAQIQKPFKVDLQNNEQKLGYVEVQIIEQKSGKSLKQIISQGVYSMRNISSTDIRDTTTFASTNFFHTQKKLTSINNISSSNQLSSGNNFTSLNKLPPNEQDRMRLNRKLKPKQPSIKLIEWGPQQQDYRSQQQEDKKDIGKKGEGDQRRTIGKGQEENEVIWTTEKKVGRMDFPNAKSMKKIKNFDYPMQQNQTDKKYNLNYINQKYQEENRSPQNTKSRKNLLEQIKIDCLTIQD